MGRESFAVEGKSFEIKAVGDQIFIDERRKGFHTTSSFHSELGIWLVKRLKDMVCRGEKLGYAGSRRRGDECLILNVKSNAKGCYLSLLSCNAGHGKMKSIYCPLSYKNKGVLLLSEAIQKILKKSEEDRKDGDSVVMEKKNGADSVIIQYGFDKRVQELRFGSFSLESKENGIPWGELMETVRVLLKLKKTPKMTEISEFKAFCEIEKGDSLVEIDKIMVFDWFDYTISIKRWSPGKETIPSNWMKTKQTWILLQGVPFHLWSDKVFSKLCKSFGSFMKVDKTPCESLQQY